MRPPILRDFPDAFETERLLMRRSARVAQRAGFCLEGELRNAEVLGSSPGPHTLVFSMIPEEYEASRPQTNPPNGRDE